MKHRICLVVAIRDRHCLVSFTGKKSRARAAKLCEGISRQGFQARDYPLSGMGPWIKILLTDMPVGELVKFLLDHFKNVVRLEREGNILKGKDPYGDPIEIPIHPRRIA